jgi:outer membrane receptor protein involved in Fe transport
MRGALLILVVLFSFAVHAFESRLVDADGDPVAGAQISVVDQQMNARSRPDGTFSLVPAPRLPATLIVIGSDGEIYPPIHLETLLQEIRVEMAFRESISVTTGTAPNIEATPAAASVVVGAEELEQRKPAHIVDAVAATPGISIRGEGPPAVPVVRGLAGGRTLLIIDDARIVAERRAGPSATFVDPLTLGSIEISRGPGSVAYGSDALGGIIHLRPRDPIPGQTDFRYDFWRSFGGVNTSSGSVDVSTDLLGGSVLASIHARSADDSEDANGNEIPNSQYRDRGALLRYVRDEEWGRLRIGVMSSASRDVGAPTSDTVATLYPEEDATLVTFALDRAHQGFWTASSVRASAGAYEVTTNRIRATGVESSTVDARDASFRMSGEHFTERTRFTTGVDFVSRFDLFSPGSIDDADRYDAGLYASWSRSFGDRTELAGGARADYVASNNRGGYFGDRSVDDVALSGFAAATVGPFSGVTFTGQIASGYREPTLSDRYFRGVSGRGFVTGNPDLDPERSVQLDGSVRWSGARSRVALFAYHYRIQDLVERYRTGADFFFRNRGESEISGVELEGSMLLPLDLQWQFGAALARGKERETGGALDDISGPSVFTSIRWAAERASAFITVSAFGRDDRPGPVEVERPGYSEIDIGGGWRILPHLEVRVVVRNATDRNRFGSADEVAALAPGRSIVIGINR